MDELEKNRKTHADIVEQTEELLQSFLQDELELSIEKIELLLDTYTRQLVTFEQAAANLDIKPVLRTLVTEELEKVFADKTAELNKEIVKNAEIIENLNLLGLLKDNVLPFLKFQKHTQDANTINARLDLLRNKISKHLQKEKRRISEFIHKEVESFFYEELINILYRKVDPHPDYKKIKFQCDFSLDKPKLNVFVTGENGDNPLIPNLYFSTAQMNILSLSIFLAKALHAKDDKGNEVNCIFIDDPIQSMDSINVLSTIDLLRSIVFKFGKQVILSTHDENFHKLLQKKIPSALFKAKYIELETFGIVKTN